jgi:hypothetical protein
MNPNPNSTLSIQRIIYYIETSHFKPKSQLRKNKMNIHTFKDAVSSKRATFADEVQDDDDDEREAAPLRRAVEGEEEDAKEQVESPF